MKTLTKLSVAAFAIVAAASCSKELQSIQSESQAAVSSRVEKTFVAQIEDTKGVIEGKVAAWEVGDSLKVYDNVAIAAASSGKTAGTTVSPAIDTFRVVAVNGSSVIIKGTVAESATSFRAVYPFSAGSGVVAGTDSVIVTVTNNQIIPQGKNIDPKALVSVAASSEGTLSFKNVVSLVKFSVSKTNVSSILISGKDGELFVGTQRVLPSSAAAGAVSSANKAFLNVCAEEGKVFAAGEYYAAVLPSSLASGVKIGCTAGGETFAKTSANAATFNRNGGLNFGAVDNGTALIKDIKTLADFKAFADAIDLYGPESVVKVSADIDFGGPTTKWATPAGSFQGTLDGQNHRIYNFVAETDNEIGNTGLINTLGVGFENDPACMKNLCVGSKDYDFSTKTGNYDGVSKISFSLKLASGYKYPGIIPYAHSYSNVENVVNFVPITIEKETNANHRAGGVCGTIKSYVTVKNCVNYGDITDNMTTGPGTGPSIGGITGAIDGSYSNVIGCVNFGKITGNSPFVPSIGGICGPATSSAPGAIIEECVNNGDVIYAEKANTALASGYLNRVGGIIPALLKAGCQIIKCVNNGDVYATKEFYRSPAFGGIVGVLGGGKQTVKGCTNTGFVGMRNMNPNVTGAFGGIVGYSTGGTTIVTITKADDGTVNKNTGTIGFEGDFTSGTLYLGGIMGHHNSESTKSVIEDCEVAGNISLKGQTTTTSHYGIGGVLGLPTVPIQIKNCKTSCNITIDGKGCDFITGGLSGGSKFPSLVENCEYSGTISLNGGKTGSTRIGGLLSLFKPEATVFRNNKFTGSIVDTDTTKTAVHLIGGLAGAVALNSKTTAITTAENCTIAGTISYAKTDKEGVVFGSLLGATAASVKGVTNFGTAEKPLCVGGSLNGTVLPATGYSTMLYGTYSDNGAMMDSGKVVFNTVNINQ